MKTDNSNENQDERYQRATRKYTVSYMSNSKWRKLFAAVDEAGIEIEIAVWRFIDSDYAFTWPLPNVCELDETRLKDGRFQPVEYKWIETIFVPREYQPYGYDHVPHATKRQDVDALVSVLRGIGMFMIDEAPDGITIRGYGGRR